MPAPKPYRSWFPDRVLLLPPDMRDWLPEEHLAWFLLDAVAQFDISAITDPIQARDLRGVVPYDPRMMVTLLLYAYCTGRPSSRQIERATYDDVAFRILADGQHPDHSTIADFRKVHLQALARLFLQVLRLCQEVGLVKLGRVALDGTKGKAKASRYKAMSYKRMLKKEEELAAEIDKLLAEAAATDSEEDKRYGKNQRGDELPKELRRRQDRLEAIRKARVELEREAAATRAEQLREQAARNRERAEDADSPGKAAAAGRRADQAEKQAEELEKRAAGAGASATPVAGGEPDIEPQVVPPGTDDADGSEPDEPDEGVSSPGATTSAEEGAAPSAEQPASRKEAGELDSVVRRADHLPRHRVQATAEGLPKPDAQRNFTDPDSRILKKGKDYVQGYNCQIVVDDANQIIVAEALTNQPPDAEHLDPMLQRVEDNCGRAPDKVLADAGYFSAENVQSCETREVDAYIAVRRQKDQERADLLPDDDTSDSTSPLGAAPDADAKKSGKPTPREKMDAKLRTPEGKAEYAQRKRIVEPVFGQMRTCQGFHEFLLRGIENVRAEWSMYCTGHNLLKLFRAWRRGSRMPWSPQSMPVTALPLAPG